VTPSEPGTSIEPGLHGRREFEVDDRLLTDVGGSLGKPVLSTPSMIEMIEWAAANTVNPRLPEGQATVGFEVCVKHVAAAASGARCVARATLREVVDGRKLFFDVDVVEGDRVIGVGTHERRVIDVRGS
jgi:fluoroacetyl-CoA thioesterase